jgi:hypothetical protein
LKQLNDIDESKIAPKDKEILDKIKENIKKLPEQYVQDAIKKYK